jgi:hypothetical protein
MIFKVNAISLTAKKKVFGKHFYTAKYTSQLVFTRNSVQYRNGTTYQTLACLNTDSADTYAGLNIKILNLPTTENVCFSAGHMVPDTRPRLINGRCGRDVFKRKRNEVGPTNSVQARNCGKYKNKICPNFKISDPFH